MGRPTGAGYIVFWEVIHSYYEKNPDQPYCAVTIPPKLEKVREKFGKLVEA